MGGYPSLLHCAAKLCNTFWLQGVSCAVLVSMLDHQLYCYWRLGLATCRSISQIVIDDSPLSADDIFVTVPLIGYRAFPKGGIVSVGLGDRWTLNGDVVYRAALADFAFQKDVGISANEIKSLPLAKLVDLYQKAPKPSDSPKCDPFFKKQKGSFQCLPSEGTAVDATGVAGLGGSELDATIIRRAFAFGAFDNPSITAGEIGVTINPEFAKRATGVYRSAGNLAYLGRILPPLLNLPK